MRILVTGARGMLGTDLCAYLRAQRHEVIEWDLPEHDITEVTSTIADVKNARPDTVFQLAAYTNVDACEDHQADAYKVNTMGTWTMAIAARDSGACLVFVSTDYVFDGAKQTPYLENDRPNPVNYYGTTKLLAEQAVRKDIKRHFICRTSWLYGRNGRNFVDAILQRAGEQETIEVVDDQKGCPTYTKDLAPALALFLDRKEFGTYHVSNSGICSWYHFAREIVRLAGLKARVLPTTSDKYVRPAKRPAFSALDNGLFQTRFKHFLRPWQEALKDYLRERRMLARD